MRNRYFQEAETLKITTLGSFSIIRGEEVISEQSRRSQKIWTLLKYILTHRKRRIPAEEFYDILWGDEDCSNPNKALQNLVYRLRMVLSAKADMEINAYIQFSQGCYYWKPLYPAALDCDEFETLVGEGIAAEQKELPYVAIDLYRKAMELYKGAYMNHTGAQDWIVATANHYRRMYLNMVHRMAYLSRALGNSEGALAVCESAFALEPYAEPLHICYIEALMDMGKTQDAQKHYAYITDALYRELGIRPSAALREAHQRVYADLDADQTDLDDLQSAFGETSRPSGAFYCEPEIFRQIYRLEARRCDRSGQIEFFAVVNITDAPETDAASRREAANVLGEVLADTLRKGDVVCRWNESQFVLLLPTLTFEDGGMVMRRLIDRFAARQTNSDIFIQHTLQPLKTSVPLQAPSA